MLRKIITLVFVAAILIIPSVAVAHNGVDHGTEREARQHDASEKQQPGTKLDDTKKRVCETRSQNITALMTRSVFRVENYGKFLATTTERLLVFAQNKQSDLVTKIETAQATFTTDLAAFKTTATFSCDSDNPKGQITAFQDAHHVVMEDLRLWRTALKDLIGALQADSGGVR